MAKPQESDKGHEILIESMFGYHTKQPIVGITIDGTRAEVTPDIARQLALQMLQAAEAAESDGWMRAFSLDRLGTSEAQAAQFMSMWREYRQEQAERTVHRDLKIPSSTLPPEVQRILDRDRGRRA